jgi:hypothetical protein
VFAGLQGGDIVVSWCLDYILMAICFKLSIEPLRVLV